MGKAKSIYFRESKTLEEAEKKAKKMDRSLSYYVDELVKKDLYLESKNRDCKAEY
jgi:hypothetical protein